MLPYLVIALVAGGGLWWWKTHPKGGGGAWSQVGTPATGYLDQYTDIHNRAWTRDLTAVPPTPVGFSDWIRLGTSTAPVRVHATTYESVGLALDNV